MIEKSTGEYYWPFEDRKPTRSEFDSFIDTFFRVSAIGKKPLEHYNGLPIKELCSFAGVKTLLCGNAMGVHPRTGYKKLSNPRTINRAQFTGLCWLLIDKAPTNEARDVLASWLFNIDAGESKQETVERLENSMRNDIYEIARKLSGESLRTLYRDAIGIEAVLEIESSTVTTYPNTGETRIEPNRGGAPMPTPHRIATLNAAERISAKN